MKLLNTYTDREEAELALQKLTGKKRLASERDSTETVYNLFGEATWTNFYKLNMYKLPLLQELLEKRKKGLEYDKAQHQQILAVLQYAARSFNLKIPPHWQ